MKTIFCPKFLLKIAPATLAVACVLATPLSNTHSFASEAPSCLSLSAQEIHSANPGFRCQTSTGVEFQKAPLNRESDAFRQDAWIDLRTGKTWGERMGRVIQKDFKLGGALLKRNQIIVESDAVSLCQNDFIPSALPTLNVFMDALVNSGLEEILPAIRFNPNSMEYYTTSTPVRGTNASTVWAIDVQVSTTGKYVYSYRAARTVRDISLNEVICVKD